MSTQLTVLKQSELCGQQFTVYGTPEEPLFKAQDLAQVLSLTNVSDMIGRVDSDEVTKLNLGSLQGETWFITESGLYEILMQSRKPVAKVFKKGVKDVLKQIRKTGGYIATAEQDTPEMIMAKALQVAAETIKKHQEKLEAKTAELAEKDEMIDEQTFANPNTFATFAMLNSRTYVLMPRDKAFFVVQTARKSLNRISGCPSVHFTPDPSWERFSMFSSAKGNRFPCCQK